MQAPDLTKLSEQEIIDLGAGGKYRKVAGTTNVGGSVVPYKYEPIVDTTTVATRQPREYESELKTLTDEVSGLNKTAEEQRKREREAAESELNAAIMGIDREVGAKLREIQEQGTKDLARTGALNIRAGLMGSNFGESNVREVEKGISKEKGIIEEYRATKSAAAKAKATGAFAEIENRYNERLKQAMDEQGNLIEKKITLDDKQRARAKENLSSIAKSGSVTYEDWLDSDLRQELIEQTGENEYVVDSLFRSNMPDSMKPKTIENYTSDANGNAILNRIIINPDGTTSEQNLSLNVPYQTVAGNKPIEVGNSLVVPDGRGGYKSVFTAPPKDAVTTNTTNTSDQLKFLRDTVAEAKNLASASGASGISKTLGNWIVGDTKFNRLEAKTNTLRTNVLTLMTDPSIKKFFGPQMSEADVRLMTAAGTTLNPENNSPEDLKAELIRLDDLFSRMQKAIPQGQQTSYTNTEQRLLMNPQTGEQFDASSLSDDEYNEALNDGYVQL